MKKSASILSILIVLMAIIGFERIENGFHFLISDDRTAREEQSDEPAKSEDTESSASGVGEQDASRSVSRFHARDRDRADTDAMGSMQQRSGTQPVEVRVTGGISPMHFIRASFIVGSTEPSKAQIDRLREAVAAVAEALRPGAVIFGADSLSTFEAPVLLFAREDFDLTAEVKLIYDRLEGASPSPAQ